MKVEIIEKLSLLATGAFGLVAALAWNSAIQKVFQHIFGEQSSIPAMLGYAVIVTAIAVMVTIWMGRLADKAKKSQILIPKIFKSKKVQEAITKEATKETKK